MTTLQAARTYVAAGLSVIPIRVGGDKGPDVSLLPGGVWKPYQTRLPTDDELRAWFGEDGRAGVAVVCGAVSGNLAVLDFDRPDVFEPWRAAVERSLPNALSDKPVVRTPSGGRHVWVRLAGGPRKSAKLARTAGGKTLVEVKGEGGYVVAPGSPAAVHASGGRYEFAAAGWLAWPTEAAG